MSPRSPMNTKDPVFGNYVNFVNMDEKKEQEKVIGKYSRNN